MLKKNLIALSVFTIVVAGVAHATNERNHLDKAGAASFWSPGHDRSQHSSRDFCQNLSGFRLDFAEKFAIVDLDLNRQQIDLLGDVKQQIRRIAERPDGVCSTPIEAGHLMQDMASAKIWLVSAQQALDDLEPPLQSFYASLDKVQQDRLSQWMSGGHHGRSR
ncbi:hypothetical protein K1W69_16240 [Hoeflea sp. WL0058]|uniref:LTXXQ motif family protein n=1 Tax=Flavimaribacter sediminis TaxID=2865987 RepID=A0AAE2ZSK6_9HYPH|nr:hypothetical protein [Flavimaribacter sediminis]MBW8638747.1 hypothetical protein [Flavimaribacter sediminis]